MNSDEIRDFTMWLATIIRLAHGANSSWLIEAQTIEGMIELFQSGLSPNETLNELATE